MNPTPVSTPAMAFGAAVTTAAATAAAETPTIEKVRSPADAARTSRSKPTAKQMAAPTATRAINALSGAGVNSDLTSSSGMAQNPSVEPGNTWTVGLPARQVIP